MPIASELVLVPARRCVRLSPSPQAAYTLMDAYTWTGNESVQSIEGGGRDAQTAVEQSVGEISIGTSVTSLFLSVTL